MSWVKVGWIIAYYYGVIVAVITAHNREKQYNNIFFLSDYI